MNTSNNNKKNIIRKGNNNIINNPFSYARSAYARKASLVEVLKARFYEPSIVADLEAAVDYAMEKTGCSESYRELWSDLCLAVGLNSFTDLVDMAVARHNQGEIHSPAALFYTKRLASVTIAIATPFSPSSPPPTTKH